jgi:hypothetical protein
MLPLCEPVDRATLGIGNEEFRGSFGDAKLLNSGG